MPSYTERHRKYYQEHKAEILAKDKEKQRWKGYYEANKETIKQRNLNRYHQRKAGNTTLATLDEFLPIIEVA